MVGLRIVPEKIDHRIILRITGRIDAASAPILEEKLKVLAEEKEWHLLLDLNRVDYLSSAGMRVLLSCLKKLNSNKGSLGLFGLSEEVADVIKMAGFDRIFRIYSSEKEALQHNQ